MNKVRNAMLTEINKQSSKIPIDSLFPKEYVISDVARKEIGKKYTDEIIKKSCFYNGSILFYKNK